MANDHEVAFPVLSAEDLAALAARGHPRAVRAGDVLFAEGDRDFCFFAVVEGEVEIVEHSRGTPHQVAVHKAGEFTGDVDMLSGRSALVTGRAATDGRVLQLSTDELRRAVDELPELGETIVRAFLMRRNLLLDDGFQGFRIIGSRFSPEAHRLRDFATRNAIPFRFMDLETDEQADAILRQLGIPASATPIVMGGDGRGALAGGGSSPVPARDQPARRVRGRRRAERIGEAGGGRGGRGIHGGELRARPHRAAGMSGELSP